MNRSARTDIHREIHFEEELVEHLLAHGWVGGGKNDPCYDPLTALVPEDVFAWVECAYEPAWKQLVAFKGGKVEDARSAFLKKLQESLKSSGLLSVLRKGFKMTGAGSTRFAMASFRPAHGLNPEELVRYGKNRCRVLRQVHYSPFRPAESIDVVLFLNGLPVATLEIKTDATQSVESAVRQYRFDRPVTDPVARSPEPLLQFGSRCLVHFAVSTDEVRMTTRLKGKDTSFLPFNLGTKDGGAGNPENGGIRTSYLWENVLEREQWLHVLGSFALDLDVGDAVQRKMIFPRYHQWDAVRKLVSMTQQEGPGAAYLVQHSAGSGKSNSIAWLAHHLSRLHRVNAEGIEAKVFRSVIVVTDRTVLDDQLQRTIKQFEQTDGVVASITKKGGSKSAALAKALELAKPIIVVTLQSFKEVLKHLQEDSNLRSHAFAIVVDEAHSSQTGSAATSLKLALGAGTDDVDEEDLEAFLLSMQASQIGSEKLSYYAFTATPKSRTMEMFGRLDEEGMRRPVHEYSMRQAIEEGFILDVLQNYTPYKVAWKLAHEGQDYDETFVEKSEAASKLVKWVRLHPTNIAQKVAIVVEHFRENVAGRLDGQAKAMVVTASRQEVVAWKQAIDAYIAKQGYKFGTLVAFSGEVNDAGVARTEGNMNPSLAGEALDKAFDGPDYRFLLVANKFQTGFDQTKLVAMYLDKKLGGVATVQTLSRLNRIHPGKDWTVVLDFVNDPAVVLEDFQRYYRGAILPQGTDPDLLLILQAKLDADGFYHDDEIERFAQFYFGPRPDQKTGLFRGLIGPALARVQERWKSSLREGSSEGVEAVRVLVKDVGTFCRLYEFLSQIVNYADNDLPKRYVFFKSILHQLQEIVRDTEGRGEIDLSTVRLTHLGIRALESANLQLDPHGDSTLEAHEGAGTGKAREKEKVRLAEVIEKLNGIFEGELTDSDMLVYLNGVVDTMSTREDVALEARQNELNSFAEGSIREQFHDVLVQHREASNAMAGQLLGDQKKLDDFMKLVVEATWEKIRNVA